MSLLAELYELLSGSGVPIETGVFSGTPPDRYIIVTPLVDTFTAYYDNRPQHEVQEVRLSLFAKGNYTQLKNQIIRTLIQAGITITDRRYIGHEDDTGYHHLIIDIAKDYELEGLS